jgi:hypothetical protein
MAYLMAVQHCLQASGATLPSAGKPRATLKQPAQCIKQLIEHFIRMRGKNGNP